MNKELETLKASYHELSRKFVAALQNNSSSTELELLRNEMKLILSKIKEMSAANEQPQDDKTG